MQSEKYPARLNVRLDDKLRSRIEAAAKASRRSLNAEICHRIEQAFIEAASNHFGREQFRDAPDRALNLAVIA